MGDADAVHLRTVLAHLQRRGQWEGRKVADLRAASEALGIPVHPKVKVPGSRSPTRGVRRVDLAPSPGGGRGDVYGTIYRRLTCTSTSASTAIYRWSTGAVHPRTTSSPFITIR
ncbi:hypothetical protein [Streptomyces sp. NPDC088812]|uniref:hypothetical protein n=1 Tax=Streptomyces sp. NPDC088812 TaxID=3365905 RepID=UPI0037F9CEFA